MESKDASRECRSRAFWDKPPHSTGSWALMIRRRYDQSLTLHGQYRLVYITNRPSYPNQTTHKHSKPLGKMLPFSGGFSSISLIIIIEKKTISAIFGKHFTSDTYCPDETAKVESVKEKTNYNSRISVTFPLFHLLLRGKPSFFSFLWEARQTQCPDEKAKVESVKKKTKDQNNYTITQDSQCPSCVFLSCSCLSPLFYFCLLWCHSPLTLLHVSAPFTAIYCKLTPELV